MSGRTELIAGELPRERMVRAGPEALTDAELLALVIGSGTRRCSAMGLAVELLRACGGLGGLARATLSDLRRWGLGPARSCSVAATVELALRLVRHEVPARLPLRRPAAVARYLGLRYVETSQEIVGAIYLDTRNRWLEDREIYRGTLAATSVEPRAILKRALLTDAASIVLFHTHPSGDPTPSAEDHAFTRRLGEVSDALGVTLVDHVVLARGGAWVSLRERAGGARPWWCSGGRRDCYNAPLPPEA